WRGRARRDRRALSCAPSGGAGMTLPPTIHATCIALGPTGILIRGDTGAGKSSLALDLLADAKAEGVWARLVADDRVHIMQRNGRLVACAPTNIAGKIEARGLGVVTLPHVPAIVVRLVVDLVDLH